MSPGHYLLGSGTFKGLDRGLVSIEYTPGAWNLSWVTEHDMRSRFPLGVVRVRPSSCFLWGQEKSGDYPHCYWFKGTTFGVTGEDTDE